MIFAGSLIVFFYTLTLGMIYFGSRSVSDESVPQNDKKTRFTIIIPFRDEAENLNALIDSLLRLNYPTHLFEIVFVNDESADNSENIIKTALDESRLQYCILKNERTSSSPKKDAITKAVKHSQYEWIMTTDADCRLHSGILNCYDQNIQFKGPNMIVGPVGIEKGKGLNFYFQQYEHLALQTLTAGGFGLKSPFLCNGANLVFLKDLFLELDGYSGNDHISTGDDIFLFEKFRRRNTKKLLYVRSLDAVVHTSPLNSWNELIEQRVRWASKISSQKNRISLWVGPIVFVTNLWLILGFIYCLINPDQFVNFLLVLLYKSLVDLIVISSSALFLSVRIKLFSFVINTLLYPYISVWVAIRSLIGSYSWKGRQYNKPLI